MKYLLVLSLILQLISQSGKQAYKEKFIPPTKTVSYTVKDADANNPNHTYTLTDEFLGIKDFPEFKLKQAYVYNEHSDDQYMGHQHWEDSPLLIVKRDKYWHKITSAKWKDVTKHEIIYIPPMEIQDENIEYNWMPKDLWIGEEWKGTFNFAAKPWTHEWHKIIDYNKGTWHIHSISIYLEAPSAMGSCYDEFYKNGILMKHTMTDCHDHLTGEMTYKP